MDMKQNSTVIIIAIAAIIIALILKQGGESKTFELVSADRDNIITISGESERLVAPDTARITFSMTRKSANLSEATDSVNARVGEMVDGLSEYGVEEKDIKTTNYSVYPEYDYARNSGERTFSGYRVNQSLELTIRDLDSVSEVVTAVATYKVDNVSGLQFYVDNDEEIREELRNEAITDAKDKARELGRELGISLNEIVGFNEGGGGYYPQVQYARSFAVEEDFAVADAAVPAGENMMRGNVSISFKIAD